MNKKPKNQPERQSDRKMSIQYGRALVQPASIDVKAREVDVVFATETPIERWGWEETYDEVLVCETGAIRMERAGKGLPVLDCHNSWSVFSQLGRTVRVWVNEAKEVCARVRFSGSQKASELFQDVADGIVTDISVGYRVYEYERQPQAEGQKPIYRAIDWEPNELSFAPVPADINSGVRGQTGEHTVKVKENRTSNTNIMTKKKRSIESGQTAKWAVEGGPVKKGDTVDTGDVKGVALDDGEDGDEIELSLIPEAAGADPDAVAAAEDAAAAAGEAATAAGDAASAAEDAAEAAAAVAGTGTGTEGEDDGARRVSSIHQMCRAAGLNDSYALALAGTNLTVDECRTAVIRRLGKRQGSQVSGHQNVTVGREAGETMRAAMQGAILHRVMPRNFKLNEAAREFRRMTLVEMSKELLGEAGVSTRGLGKNQIADLVFGTRAHSTSDFPSLFGGVIDRLLRTNYEYAPEFWDKIARETTVMDFREKGIYKSESKNGMKKVAEGAELKYTTMEESDDKISVETFAQGIRLTRQAFINDDLGAFATIPATFAQDWNIVRGDSVWGLVTGNAKLADGKALFDAAHTNLITGATSVLSADSLATAKTLLARQKSLAGKSLRILPKFLVVPPELEMLAKKLITQTTPASSDDVNVFANAFDVIVEPRLVDTTAWYLFADPYAVDGIYYAYLEGDANLRVNSEENFNTDTMDYAVRGDFGTAAIDYRGAVKSAGK